MTHTFDNMKDDHSLVDQLFVQLSQLISLNSAVVVAIAGFQELLDLFRGGLHVLFLEGVVNQLSELIPGERASAVFVVLKENFIESFLEIVVGVIWIDASFLNWRTTCATAH